MIDNSLIRMVDMFRFSNHYALTSDFHKSFIGDERAMEDCIRYVSKSRRERADRETIVNLYL